MTEPAYGDITTKLPWWRNGQTVEYWQVLAQGGFLQGYVAVTDRMSIWHPIRPGATLNAECRNVVHHLLDGTLAVNEDLSDFEENRVHCFAAHDTTTPKTNPLSYVQEARARFVLLAALPLHEPIAWGGPIVMNTEAELALAFEELEAGTFIK